ncbi:MAG TPA: LysR family transcriptional regulator substrate-binding protein [Rhodopila sp.]|nr:LysR family transcriptional regulator substrate-binding protein [Rhodopila sp.]
MLFHGVFLALLDFPASLVNAEVNLGKSGSSCPMHKNYGDQCRSSISKCHGPEAHSNLRYRGRAGQFVERRAFDAACRLAGLKPNIRLNSRTPHTLLALAEAGHGVAIIPSQFRTDRYVLRIVGLTYNGRPLTEPLAMLWDRRRPLPRYATGYREMLRSYVREVFPIHAGVR